MTKHWPVDCWPSTSMAIAHHRSILPVGPPLGEGGAGIKTPLPSVPQPTIKDGIETCFNPSIKIHEFFNPRPPVMIEAKLFP